MTEMFALFGSIDFSISTILLIIISSMLALVSIALVATNNLLGSVILMSFFSLLISLSYLLMDAPDVAMTEVALGAALSTAVLLNIIRTTSNKNESYLNFLNLKHYYLKHILALILCICLGLVLIFIGAELPSYGSSDAAIHNHISQYYIKYAKLEIDIPSMVAALLASYRGYDTLGETSVVLIAGLSVVLILSKCQNKKDN
ncbi:MAG: DUF4040 domain-containing protein [Rickettsiaceae bacterium]